MSKDVEDQVIECEKCRARVQAKVLKSVEHFDPGNGEPERVYFMQCNLCKNLLLGESQVIQVGFDQWEFSDPTRLWPNPKNIISHHVPKLVRDSIEESMLCYGSGAYSACAVMCRRSIESICKDSNATEGNLQKKLKSLKEIKIIDGRLYEWSDLLRESGNSGAHDPDIKITKQDAKDLLDFTLAITDYIYVLTEKFNSFKERKT